jgi:hypothetical protein
MVKELFQAPEIRLAEPIEPAGSANTPPTPGYAICFASKM